MPRRGLAFSAHTSCVRVKRPVCSLPPTSCRLFLPIRSAFASVRVPRGTKKGCTFLVSLSCLLWGTHFFSQTSCLLKKASRFTSADILSAYPPYPVGVHRRSSPPNTKRPISEDMGLFVCRGGDSNPHRINSHRYLKPACLPIPPPRRLLLHQR